MNTDKNIPTVADIVRMFKKIDSDTAKKVLEALNKERVFAGCATFSCKTKNHGEVG